MATLVTVQSCPFRARSSVSSMLCSDRHPFFLQREKYVDGLCCRLFFGRRLTEYRSVVLFDYQ